MIVVHAQLDAVQDAEQRVAARVHLGDAFGLVFDGERAVLRERPPDLFVVEPGRDRGRIRGLERPQVDLLAATIDVHLGKCARVMFSAGAPAAATRRSSSMRTPPSGWSASTSFQSMRGSRARSGA